MKSRLSLIFAALVVLLFAMIWVVRDRGIAAPEAAAGVPVLSVPEVAIQAAPVAAPVATVVVPPAAANPIQAGSVVSVGTDGALNYTAHDGDTVSQLAVALLGSDSKANREIVIAANHSLQANPDRVLAGETYSMPAAADQPVAASSMDQSAPAIAQANDKDQPKDQPADSQRELKYTAQHGDSVSGLAANLLGGDTKNNRDTIINSNASLQEDPNRLVAGKTYTIVTTSGLAADPSAVHPALPTTRANDDDAAGVHGGRELRYTAQAGDTLSKLATVLLGSDTKANRDLISQSNPSLKQDPDHLVAGKTYWIVAPVADAAY